MPGWSPTLVATLRMALKTRFAVALFWGPEQILIYDQAYVAMIGDKHPAALGRPVGERHRLHRARRAVADPHQPGPRPDRPVGRRVRHGRAGPGRDGRRAERGELVNAGHAPPALLAADDTVRLLQTPPETLLGTRGAVQRTDHTVVLEPGATLVFYTDGLVERRRTVLDEGLHDLVDSLAGRQQLDAEQFCDHLRAEHAAGAEDNIALCVIRAEP